MSKQPKEDRRVNIKERENLFNQPRVFGGIEVITSTALTERVLRIKRDPNFYIKRKRLTKAKKHNPVRFVSVPSRSAVFDSNLNIIYVHPAMEKLLIGGES